MIIIYELWDVGYQQLAQMGINTQFENDPYFVAAVKLYHAKINRTKNLIHYLPRHLPLRVEGGPATRPRVDGAIHLNANNPIHQIYP